MTIFLSFVFFMLLFVFVGFLSSLKSKKTTDDYLLASRKEHPIMIALSAVATNNSGYMFIGVIGYTYLQGIAVIWIFLPLIIGDFCASLFAYKEIRIISAKINAKSFPETIGRWSGIEFKTLRIIASIILLIFLSIYASAQLRAGGKAIHAIFGWQDIIGTLIGTIIVLIYCFLGGIRASIWTNTIQSIIMILSMILLFFMALNYHGGIENFIESLKKIDGKYLSLIPNNNLNNPAIALGLFIFGWFFGGLGIIGQPHIMTSFMAMSNPNDIKKIRIYYYTWYCIFFIFTIMTGLISRAIIDYNVGYDPELSLPLLAKLVMPEILVGFILAGIFSATMSTADSQIICCSATISNDIFKNSKQSFKIAKISTVLVAIISFVIAIIDSQTVFSLVMLGWLALSCSFTPIIIIYTIEKNPTQSLLIGSMIIGLLSMLIWRYFDLGNEVYEAGIGIPAGLIYYLIWKKLKRTKIN